MGEMWRKKVETVPTAFKDDVLVIQKHLMNISDKKERPKRRKEERMTRKKDGKKEIVKEGIHEKEIDRWWKKNR